MSLFILASYECFSAKYTDDTVNAFNKIIIL